MPSGKPSKSVSRGGTKWTQEEIDFLKQHYPTRGKLWCATQLNRTEASVRQQAFELKLRLDHTSDFCKEWQTRAAESKRGVPRPYMAEVMRRNWREGKFKLRQQPEWRRKLSEALKQWHQENDHPRGFLGGTHTDEAKALISRKSKKRWNEADYRAHMEKIMQSPQYKKKRSAQMVKRLKKNPGSVYSKARRGRRADLDNLFVRSAWEANYARYLNFLKTTGEIHDWQYEPDTFWFEAIRRGTRSYTPDFKIWVTEDATPYYVEVKGFMDSKSKTKLKRMAKYHPDVEVRVVGQPEYNELMSWAKNTIPNME